MKVIVTGGMGFLGNSLVSKLLDCGYEVHAVGRTKEPKKEKLLLGIQYHACDLANNFLDDKILKNTDLVVHTAAKAGVSGNYHDYYLANFTATKNLLDSCRSSGISRFIHTSTPSVVFTKNPIQNGNEILPYLSHSLSPYASTKAMAEKLVLQANNPPHLQTLALRPHLVWGKGDPHLLPRVIKRHKEGKLKIVGLGNNQVDLTHIVNVTHAHMLAIDAIMKNKELGGKPYFIGQEEPVVLWDWLNDLFSSLKLAPVTKKISFRIAYHIGWVMEMLWKLLSIGGDPPMTRFVASQLAHDHWFSSKNAKEDFGYSPILSMQEAMKETLPWLKKI